jgi:hypothetical protein
MSPIDQRRLLKEEEYNARDGSHPVGASSQEGTTARGTTHGCVLVLLVDRYYGNAYGNSRGTFQGIGRDNDY